MKKKNKMILAHISSSVRHKCENIQLFLLYVAIQNVCKKMFRSTAVTDGHVKIPQSKQYPKVKHHFILTICTKASACARSLLIFCERTHDVTYALRHTETDFSYLD